MFDQLRQALGYQMPRSGGIAFRAFRRWGPATVRTRLFPDIYATLNLKDLSQLYTFWQGERFERPTAAVLQTWLRDASVFFDVGSNYGFFSYLALSSRPDIQVHAFEPHPRTFGLLQKIKAENHLDHLSCWNYGLADQSGKLELHAGTEDLGHSTFGKNPEHTDANPVFSIPVRTFSDWRREQGIPLPTRPEWVIKMDIEGFELKALQGMREELAAKAFKGLIVEINPITLAFCNTSTEAILTFLEGTGYRPATAREINPALSGECVNYFFVPCSD